MICILLARGGSKGIPKKNIIDFNGHPLIYYSIKQALNSKYIKEVYVSSDSDEILNISSKYGAKPVKRPESIAGDKSSSEDALIHCIDCIGNLEEDDTIVFMQVTSPLRESIDIDKAIENFQENDYDSLFTASALEDLLIWEIKQGNLKSLNYDYKSRKMRQENSPQFVENGSIYIFKKSILYTNKNRLGGKIGIYIMENWKMFEIDDYEGLDLCKMLYANKLNGKQYD
jgi:CMP-N,N'-diacetyllegionaminic acid synthase